MKTCPKCGIEKEDNQFYRRFAQCKRCSHGVTRSYNVRPREFEHEEKEPTCIDDVISKEDFEILKKELKKRLIEQ